MDTSMKIVIELDARTARDLALLTHGSSTPIEGKARDYIVAGIEREVVQVLNSQPALKARSTPMMTGLPKKSTTPGKSKYRRVKPEALEKARVAVTGCLQLLEGGSASMAEIKAKLSAIDGKVIERAVKGLVERGTLRRVGTTSKTRYLIRGA